MDPPPSSRSAAGDHTDRAAAATSANTAEVGALTAVWCCSVGATWTLELRELDHGRPFGAIVDWISSGVPVSQPAPEALAHELLAARGLRLFSDSPANPPPATGTASAMPAPTPSSSQWPITPKARPHQPVPTVLHHPAAATPPAALHRGHPGHRGGCDDESARHLERGAGAAGGR